MTFSSDNKDLIDLGFTLEGDWVGDVHDLYTKAGVSTIVRSLTNAQLKDYLKFRLDMLQEELDEARKAFEEKDADGVVDAIIDLSVFAIGTLDAFEVDAYEAWARVHEANMAKEPGVKPGRPNPWKFPDLLKPEGWQAPSHHDNVGLIAQALGE